jgi:hypothetical protein
MTEKAILESAKSALSGMVAIRDFCRSINLASSEASVIQMVRESGFPAKKLGGIWESDKESIVEWRKKYINGEVKVKVEAEEKPKTEPQAKKIQQSVKPGKK